MRTISYCFMAVICLCLIIGQAQAKDIKISLPLLPVLVDSKDKGILVDLCKAMAKEYKDGKIAWDVFPFPRSLQNVERGRADFHIPYITPHNPQKTRFQYSTDNIFKVVIALYTNKNNKEINPKNVTRFKIETDEGVKYIFESEIPNITGSPSIESSMKKVDMGRIDAWLMAMPESDTVLKKLALKNIKRWEYGKYDVKAVLPLGEKGKETDKILSGLIKNLKASGEYQKIMGPILDQKFIEQ